MFFELASQHQSQQHRYYRHLKPAHGKADKSEKQHYIDIKYIVA